jgi:hypothetical protein
MATLTEIIDGIETRLQTITGLRTKNVSPGQITPPCAIVEPPPIDYLITFDQGYWDINPTITVFTSASMDRAGQRALMGYADPSGSGSVYAAIAADQTLGGKVDFCAVQSFRPLGLEEVGILEYYGGVFTLHVSAAV